MRGDTVLHQLLVVAALLVVLRTASALDDRTVKELGALVGGDTTHAGSKKWVFRPENSHANSSLDSTPVLSPDGSLVYISSTDCLPNSAKVNYFYAVNVMDGTKKWAFKTGLFCVSPPVLSPNGSVAYVATASGRYGNGRWIYAINTGDGSKKWALKLADEGETSPALSPDGSIVYVTSSGELHAINTKNGSKIWTFELKIQKGWGIRYAYSPKLSPDGSTVYVIGDYAGLPNVGGWLFAVDAHEGYKKWVFEANPSEEYTTALSPDGAVVYTSGDGLFAVNATDGSEKWRFGGDLYGQLALSHNGSIIYLVTGQPSLCAINADDGSVTAAFKIPYTETSPTLSPDGSMLYMVSDAYLCAMSAHDGAKKWTFNMGTRSFGDVTLSLDGLVAFVGSSDGYLYAVNTKDASKDLGRFHSNE